MHVQFAFNRADLNDSAQTALLGIAKELNDNPQLRSTSKVSRTRAASVTTTSPSASAEWSRCAASSSGTVPIFRASTRWDWGPLLGGKEEAARQRRVTVKLMLSAQ